MKSFFDFFGGGALRLNNDLGAMGIFFFRSFVMIFRIKQIPEIIAQVYFIGAKSTQIVLLVGLVAVLAVVFVTRTGLSIHRNVIEILHLIGAQDNYIAKQFQRHSLALGLRGGMIGSALALATILTIGYMLGRVESALVPVVLLSLPEWALLALLPFATAGIAMVTARMTVLGTLARMP